MTLINQAYRDIFPDFVRYRDLHSSRGYAVAVRNAARSIFFICNSACMAFCALA